jgi:uncharacterized membrane protein
MLYFLCLVAIGMAIWNRGQMDRFRASIAQLERELAILKRAPAVALATPAPAASATPEVAPEPAVAAPEMSPAPAPEAPAPAAAPEEIFAVHDNPTPDSILIPESPAEPPLPAATPDEVFAIDDHPPADTTPPIPEPRPQPKAARTIIDFERQFGARLPVWIGGIALALAGFFLVRYTIEIGLLTETVRVVLGGIFGLTLIGAGQWATRKDSLANGKRIGQALSGAGIADLYASLFVATTLYHLLSPAVGFVAMAAVTVGAVVLSLRHGAPIAVLGLVGGFLTPVMTGTTEPNAPLLFGYLYCLLVGFFVVIKKKSWWLLATPMVAAAFGWIFLWLESGGEPQDSIWPLLFVIAIGATLPTKRERAGNDRQRDEQPDEQQNAERSIHTRICTTRAEDPTRAIVA